MGVHRCTDEDWLKFSPPKKDKKERFDILQQSNTMFCLNADDLIWDGKPLSLYGSNSFTDHRRLEIRFLPCELKNVTNENSSDQCSVNMSN